MSEFIKALVHTSEKAANLARAIRAEADLFSLLVQEKDSAEKNQRFVQDFKTLGDVLIQETIKHDLVSKFSEIKASDIHGEESNKFTNQLGESIVIEVKSSAQETAALLSKVLNNNLRAANLLASVVHNDVVIPTDAALDGLTTLNLPVEEFGIWIDPIDSTAEYIYGKDEDMDSQSFCTCGLPCVTVLIGVFDKKTGLPVVGVVNQPFYKINSQTKKWTGRSFWGVYYEGQKFTSVLSSSMPELAAGHGTVLISASDDDVIKESLAKEFEVKYAAGAGYKLLCIVLGIADAYVLSRGTTFRWDSCAPHALARSIGGGVVDYRKASRVDLKAEDVEFHRQMSQLQLKYHEEEQGMLGAQKWCNAGGIIAYRDAKFLHRLLEALSPLTQPKT